MVVSREHLVRLCSLLSGVLFPARAMRKLQNAPATNLPIPAVAITPGQIRSKEVRRSAKAAIEAGEFAQASAHAAELQNLDRDAAGAIFARLAQGLLRSEDYVAACAASYAAERCGHEFRSFRSCLMAQESAQVAGDIGCANALSARLTELNAVVAKKLKLVYVAIPKNACTSLKMAAINATEMDAEFSNAAVSVHAFMKSHFAFPQESKEAQQAREDFRWIVVLRNPFSRLVSAYLNKIVGSERDPAKHFGRVQKLRHGLPTGSLDPKRGVTFAEFIRGVAGTTDIEADEHWRQQSIYVGTDLNRYAYVGRLEGFQKMGDDLAEFGLRLVPANRNRTVYMTVGEIGEAADILPAQIQAAKAKPAAKSFYREDLVELVARRYAQDINLYHRAFGITPAPY